MLTDADACSVDNTDRYTRQELMLIRPRLGCRSEGAGADLLVLQRQRLQVSQGWLDSRLNIAKENMNKTNLILTVQLPPSIT